MPFCSTHHLFVDLRISFEPLGTSLVAQTVKRLPTMQEIQVQSLGREDLLEKEIATCSVFLPRKSHGWRSLVSHSPWGHKESDMTEQLHFHFSLLCKNRAFLVAQIVKNLPVMQETWV